MDLLKIYLLLKMVIFHFHVSLLEGIWDICVYTVYVHVYDHNPSETLYQQPLHQHGNEPKLKLRIQVVSSVKPPIQTFSDAGTAANFSWPLRR